MQALNLEIEYPVKALPSWANRWAYEYHSRSVIPVRFANGLAWIASPNDAGALPQVPTGIVILDDPYAPIERFMWMASTACLFAALIINLLKAIGE